MRKQTIIASVAILIAVLLLPVVYSFSVSVTNKNELVEALKRGIESKNTSFTVTYISDNKLDGDEVKEALAEAFSYYPYQRNNYSRLKYNAIYDGKTNVLEFSIDYRTTLSEEKAIDDYVSKYSETFKTKTSSKVEQVKLVNNNLKELITYSKDGISYATAFGAIEDGLVVCHGYTLLAERFFQKLEIESKIVIGDVDGVKHSWNLVKIDSNWYHLDITYNDSFKDSDPYFLISDKTISKDRTWNYNEYPKALKDYSNDNIKNESIDSDELEDLTLPKIETEPVIPIAEEIYPSIPDEIKILTNDSFLTREAFTEYIMQLYYKVKGKDASTSSIYFKDTDNNELQKARELGLIYGKSNDLFDPYSYITREEAAVIISRVILLEKPELAKETYINNIRDYEDISSWARDSVLLLNNYNIMVGIGNDVIAPKNYVNKYQAEILINKTYDLIK